MQTDFLPALAAAYTENEADVLAKLVTRANLSENDRKAISEAALKLVAELRADGRPVPLMDALLQEYGLSTEEGVALMRLSEALIRTPDFPTARQLIRDKLIDANWSEHAGQAPAFLVNQATNGLRLSTQWIKASGGMAARNLASKLGDRVLGLAMNRVMGVMAEHFVLGRSIEDAAKNARAGEANGQTFSYDMLGEAALTQADADDYFAAYKHAVTHLAKTPERYASIAKAPGISVKLSALHPRYEYAKRETCMPALVARLTELASIAKHGGLSLAIDAEETDRLELSLLIFEQLLQAPELADWDGLGLVVQAYQRRAMPLLEHVITATRAAQRSITIRLVKGAYWDSEIKRAQEMGLESYPVFTRKENTDVSYLACARIMLDAGDVIFPQFASHNAHTIAAIAHMAAPGQAYEIQRLHGMGKSLHDTLSNLFGIASRIYAPVGEHEDLLPYLVRRLLENGANSSFVNQVFDMDVKADMLVTDPITVATAHAYATNPKLPIPRAIAEGGRLSARGLDLTQAEISKEIESAMPLGAPYSFELGKLDSEITEIYNPAKISELIGRVATHDLSDMETAIATAKSSNWSTIACADRASILERVGDLLEAEMQDFLQICVLEAGKTLPDAVAEVREAIDFCRYYARQSLTARHQGRAPLGIVACISPWNFPLAIFLGQIIAALSMGNTVVAKPAEQTPLISLRALDLLKRAGVPPHAVQLLVGDGAKLGTALTRHTDVAGVCFTGSTATAKAIGRALADTGRATLPFIAETGGINTMIIDSTALLEQAVKDVVASSFQSAGQRCSACRIVCVQDEIAGDFITMLSGAMSVLTIGDPAKLETDIGPVIDAGAREMIESYIAQTRQSMPIIATVPPHTVPDMGYFVIPTAFEITHISDVTREVFGPVLHILRFKSAEFDTLIADINATGFGLTMGLHTRLDNRVDDIAERAHVGNLYVNRNQIGAVVGTQPFGGEGLSGTGPKAGGPHYLLRLSHPPENMHAAPVESRHVLPGPTGEQNTLKLFPRGVILCLGGDVESMLEVQARLALAAGNKILLPLSPYAQAAQKKLSAEFPESIIEMYLDTEVDSLIAGDIDGICVDGSQREKIGVKVSEREGAIIPILSAKDDPERFYHERTLTINTTAAGGNASLLAMG